MKPLAIFAAVVCMVAFTGEEASAQRHFHGGRGVSGFSISVGNGFNGFSYSRGLPVGGFYGAPIYRGPVYGGGFYAPAPIYRPPVYGGGFYGGYGGFYGRPGCRGW